MANVALFGPWGPESLAFARSLRRRGIGTYLVHATDQRPERWSLSSLRGSATMPARLEQTPEGIAWLADYVRGVDASALVATRDGDLTWLARHRHVFEPGCRVLVQPADSLHALLSKRHQASLANDAGLTVLPTHVLTHHDDADSIPASDYPLALRPDRPGDVEPAFKVRFVASRDQLQQVIRDCTRIASPILAQPFQRLPNLVIHGVRSIAGDVIASRCYRVPRKFEGVTLTLEPMPFPEGLETACATFARLAEITGCYHLEFLHSGQENLAHFLEVNVRMGGTTDKVVRTGFDEPCLLLQAYGIATMPTSRARHVPRRVANKRALLKHIVHAAKGSLTALDYPDVNRWRHIAYSCRDLMVAKDSIFDWRDVSGSLRFHLRGLMPARR
jgi:hypothetical protein